MEARETYFRKTGGDPENANNPGRSFIDDDLRPVFNPLTEVKIADRIIKYLNDSLLISITDQIQKPFLFLLTN